MLTADLSLSKYISDLKTGNRNLADCIHLICNRIDNNDKFFHAFLPEPGRRERLLKDAIELENRFPNPQNRPLFFGVPVGVKDIFNVNGFETRAGSKLPSGCFSGSEAKVVTALKNAGALILGKTVTTEFAFFEPGPTCNPHNTKHTPGGSSSGSAAAVACGFSPIALGTQTIGSIARPASYCGVFGYKPSFGRISTQGVVPFSTDADHIGFFTQDLDGLQIAASFLCRDWKINPIFTNRKPVIGIPAGEYWMQADSEMQNAINKIIDRLKQKGFEVKTQDIFGAIQKLNVAHRAMVAVGFYKVHKSWFGQYRNLYSKHSAKLIEEGMQTSSIVYDEALKGREELRKKLENYSKKESIDVWMSPSAMGAAPEGLDSTGSPLMNLPWTYAGVPTITAPLAKNGQGMPLGIQFSGFFNQDENLFESVKQILDNIMFE